MKTAKCDCTKIIRPTVDASIMIIVPRCTHRRVPGSRLVGAGDADVAVARCSLKIIFFVTLLANNLGKEQTGSRRALFPPNTALSYHNNAYFYS